MALTVIKICNMALSHIGQSKTIASLDEVNPGAQQCKLLFDLSRDAVLRAHPWNFAEKIEALVLISGESILGWDYLYQKPAKCLNALAVLNASTLTEPRPQKFKAVMSPLTNVQAIACNLEGAYLKYTKQVEDPAVWDSMFADLVSWHLAAALAVPITGKNELALSCMQMFASKQPEAMRMNAGESQNTPEQSSEYVNSR
jgi:hypothetical protein